MVKSKLVSNYPPWILLVYHISYVDKGNRNHEVLREKDCPFPDPDSNKSRIKPNILQ